MSDDLLIRNVQARFCRYLDGRRFDEWSQLFAENAEFAGIVGRANILAQILKGGLANQPDLFRQHMAGNITIEFDTPNSARVESDLLLVERVGDDPWIIRTGRYRDRMVRGSGGWLFAQRLLDWTANPLGPNG